MTKGNSENGDPSRGTRSAWKSLADMTRPRGNAGSVSMNNGHQFLVIGGYKGYWDCWTGGGVGLEFHSSCEYYDTRTGLWNELAIDMPVGLECFGVATSADGNRIFVMGGWTGSRIARADLISIDLSSGNGDGNCDLSTLGPREWETLAPMTRPRADFACVSHENYIYVFGGSEFGVESAEKYSIETNEWQTLPNLPGTSYRRASCTAGVIGNKIFVVGSKWSCVFDISEQRWESQAPNPNRPKTASNNGQNNSATESVLPRTIPELNTNRYGCSVVAMDRSLIVIGGEGRKCKCLSTIEVFADNAYQDADEEQERKTAVWKYASTPMKHPRASAVAGFLKETNEIIVAGGKSEMDSDMPPYGTSDSIVWKTC